MKTLIRHFCSQGWKINPVKTKRLATSVRFVGVQLSGAYREIPSKINDKWLHLVHPNSGKKAQCQNPLWVLEEVYSMPGNASLAHTSVSDIKGVQCGVRLTAGKGCPLGHRTHRPYDRGICSGKRCCEKFIASPSGCQSILTENYKANKSFTWRSF